MNLKSTVEEQGRYVTQILHFSGGNKRTFAGIDSHTIKQGEFTKMKTKDGRVLMINTQNVDLVEVFSEKNVPQPLHYGEPISKAGEVIPKSV